MLSGGEIICLNKGDYKLIKVTSSLQNLKYKKLTKLTNKRRNQIHSLR